MTTHYALDLAGGLSLTTQYALDSERGAAPLAATANNQSTYYLYGLGAAAERAAGWSYYLHDGLGSLRKMIDADAETTLELSYTPWGDVLSQSGTITPARGYLGGWVDVATGLIYVGNGQYYDPHTGRFLTRDAQPGKLNPYVPGNADPTGLLIGPMALLVLARGRKGKKGSSKADFLILFMVVLLICSLTVTACVRDDDDDKKPPTTPGGQGGGEPTPTGTRGSPTVAKTEGPHKTPSQTATACPTLIATPTDDLLHITGTDLAKLSMGDYLKTEPEPLLMARVAVGEGVQDDMKDQENIMWTIIIRSAIGYSKYRAGQYGQLNSTSIKEEIFAPDQYTAITGQNGEGGIITGDNWMTVINGSLCANSFVRMGNPCPGNDTEALRSAYMKAQEILGMDIKEAPDAIKCFESYVSPKSPETACQTLENPRNNLRPMAQYNNGSKFMDCSFADNLLLFGSFAEKNGWIP